MLKITSVANGRRRTLVLEGSLVDPWLTELERAWDESRDERQGYTLAIDLKDVTVISERGEGLLSRMMSEGAHVNCCQGVLTRHVLERLATKRVKRNGKRGDDK
jgi:hypothetical protein